MAQAAIAQISDPDQARMDRLADDASLVGKEVVEVSGALDAINAQCDAQIAELHNLRGMADEIISRNGMVGKQTTAVQERATESISTIAPILEDIKDASAATRSLAHWVEGLAVRITEVEEMLGDVRKSNELIGSIAAQVNILAINAKIEAARAGDAGKGFAVVAEAVNDLSKKTKNAASDITHQVENLSTWVGDLSTEAQDHGVAANQVQESARHTEGAMDQMHQHVEAIEAEAKIIGEHSRALHEAGAGFGPALNQIGQGAQEVGTHIAESRNRLHDLIDASERLVQGTVAIGGSNGDAKFLDRVRQDARALGRRLEEAVDQGQITLDDLLDQTYVSIPGTDPEQLLAKCTELTDSLFPDIQEAAASFDERVVFCAAVDQNGYLPTHNRKFSHPQGADPIWNSANARNRRLFDDRVGLKAGRNTDDFLLQVYRRDMGGGQFRMMKDLSAPIFVKGKHWGGLRLAYAF